MNLVQQELDLGNLSRARDRLDRDRPARKPPGSGPRVPPPPDLRGWEWRYLWARARSDEHAVLCQVSNDVTLLAYSWDRSLLALGRSDGGTAVWNLSERRWLGEWPRGGASLGMALSPSGNLLARAEAATSGQPVVSLRDLRHGGLVLQLAHSHAVLSLAFAPAEDELAALTFDGVVRLWHLPSGREVRRLSLRSDDPSPGRYSMVTDAREIEPMGSNASTEYGRLLYSADGRHLIIGEAKPHLRLMDRAGGNDVVLPIDPPGDGVTALAASPDGRWLAAGAG